MVFHSAALDLSHVLTEPTIMLMVPVRAANAASPARISAR
ncbi:hypothetical protein STXM2123_743 [Streptomyces sp. F-3]|nr:hypothetical protein STXM2123_743 [Streptomyces sp. F-3]